MSKSYHIETYGCQMNVADSELVSAMLQKAGYLETKNIEMQPGKGGEIARSAGAFGTLVAREGKYATIKLPSGEVRMILCTCMATIGALSNSEHSLQRSGKAGRSRWLGRRPRTRGVAMNPIDHPHGGGEGKSSGGRPSVTPWSKPAHGKKTRKK